MKSVFIFISLIFISVSICFSQENEKFPLKSVNWNFSELDYKTEIKEQIKNGDYELKIIRKGSDSEIELIKKAEALYPENSDINSKYDPNKTSEFLNPKFNPIIEEKPYWSESIFDDVKIASFISTRAISYYQQMSLAFRMKQKLTRIKMLSTSFSYTGEILNKEKYEINNQKFENVKIAVLELGWSQECGNLCAMGFGRTKIVIFDKENKPIAMFIDTETGAVVS